jgi:metal-responsive CopG/Arc/MetJ family transcriptional regulator
MIKVIAMKVRTSVTISSKLLVQLNELAGKRRSEIIETALQEYFKKNSRQERDKREFEIINKNADLISNQALETLEYQAEWWNLRNEKI